VKNIVYILFILSLTGCGAFKDKQRSRKKVKTHVTERGVRILEIPKDSIVYVPNVIIRHKDTTITVENPNLKLQTRFRNGRVERIKAIQKPKKQINSYERTETRNESTRETRAEGMLLKPVYFVYVFAGLGFLILVNNLTKKR